MFEVKDPIESKNYYKKNWNTIQLTPETKNISVVSIAIPVSWIGPTRKINYIVGLHIPVLTLKYSAVHSLTYTARIVVSCQKSPLSAVWCNESSRKSAVGLQHLQFLTTSWSVDSQIITHLWRLIASKPKHNHTCLQPPPPPLPSSYTQHVHVHCRTDRISIWAVSLIEMLLVESATVSMECCQFIPIAIHMSCIYVGINVSWSSSPTL